MIVLRKYSIALILMFMFARLSAAVEPAAPARVECTLLADAAGIEPGKPFTLGVQFNISPGWHIYWENPGDAGAATRVKFSLPEGFSAGELRFPVPERMDQAGAIVAYGYENSVLLMARITPPKELPPNFVAHFSANASWLVCQDVCVPGKQQVQLDLPVNTPMGPANAALFTKWEARIPVDSSVDPRVAAVAVHGGIKEGQNPASGRIFLEISWKTAPPDSIQFLPGQLDGYNISQCMVNSQGNVTRIGFSLQTLAGQKPVPAKLEVVVGYTIKNGEKRGFKTVINLPDSGQK